jgi:DNA-binding FadR family transcriptional regulator
MSDELGISVASLREQLEVARAFGLVEVRPRTGIRRLPYQFGPAVQKSLAYAVAIGVDNFEAYTDLRNHLEAAYWREAVILLTSEDRAELNQIVARAQEKLNRFPVQIPHQEHKNLHLLIYNRLNNPFVYGLLEAYWEIYEALGLSIFADYSYLKRVWNYHQKMVDAICSGNVEAGYQSFKEHTLLLSQRSQNLPKQHFE